MSKVLLIIAGWLTASIILCKIAGFNTLEIIAINLVAVSVTVSFMILNDYSKKKETS